MTKLFNNFIIFLLGGFGGFLSGQISNSKRIQRNKEKFFIQKKIIQNYKNFINEKNLTREFDEFNFRKNT
jgi:hypothetical protein